MRMEYSSGWHYWKLAEDLAASLGTSITDFLGDGKFGSAYLLNSGLVLKITTDLKEVVCVPKIVEIHAWTITPHLPVITASGWRENFFYYVREYTENLHIDTSSPEYDLWVNSITDIIEQIEDALGCGMTDDALNPGNWGIRPQDGQLVWRDLSCKC